MSLGKPRYALYFAPDPASPLWGFGSGTIGYDAATGVSAPPVAPPGIGAIDWSAATEEPRRYGFHATLKAPFELHEDATEAALIAHLADFAANTAALPDIPLVTAALGAFIALVPEAPDAGLNDLAFRTVEAFEPFRAPISPADRARRLASPLTPRQIAYLDRYGYPYAREDFRFHMTLTGKLRAAEIEPVRAALSLAHAAAVPSPETPVDSIALFRQAERQGPFRIIARNALKAG